LPSSLIEPALQSFLDCVNGRLVAPLVIDQKVAELDAPGLAFQDRGDSTDAAGALEFDKELHVSRERSVGGVGRARPQSGGQRVVGNEGLGMKAFEGEVWPLRELFVPSRQARRLVIARVRICAHRQNLFESRSRTGVEAVERVCTRHEYVGGAGCG